MYKLVIADDEKNISDGIRVTVENACPEATIMGVFYNGKELLDYLKDNPTDILICDICMQDNTGLDIAAFIDEHKLNTHIILITGHRLFEYAHQAIKYHVDFFLTKPFSSTELVDAIKKIEQAIDTRVRNSVYAEKSIRHDWNEARQNVQKFYAGTWDSLISPISSLTAFQAHDLQIHEIHYKLFPDSETEEIQTRLEDIVDDIVHLGEISSNDLLCFYCGQIDGELLFVSFCDKDKPLDFTNKFITEMSTTHNLSFNSMFHKFNSIDEYYYHCRSRHMFNELLLILSNNHKQSWDMLLDVTMASFSPEECSALLNYVISHLGEYTLYNEEDKKSTIKRILTNIQGDYSKTDALIGNAITYIENNYANPSLSRDMIADQLAVSSSYLSRAFSHTLGQSLNSFILKTRMEKAKKLLVESTLSTAHIAQAVGYNDSSYFKRSFKTYTGVTPTKFKNIQR